MGTLIGTVLKMEELEKRNGKAPPWSVSIDGYSALVGTEVIDDVKGVLQPGSRVSVDFRVFWPSGGKRPVHWVQSAEALK